MNSCHLLLNVIRISFSGDHMSRYRVVKEKEKYNKLVKILNDRFNGDLNKLKEAEEYLNFEKKIDKERKVFVAANRTIELIDEDNKKIKDKVTYVDTKNNEISLTDAKNSLVLGYNMDSYSMMRISPITITSFLESLKSKDLAKSNNKGEVLNILNFVKSRIVSRNISLSGLHIDKTNKIIEYSTNIVDQQYGSVRQYITSKADLNSIVTISSMMNKKVDYWASEYKTLFAFFTLFSMNEIYFRCTCPEYNRKYSKRLGIGNYMCNHILNSISMFPYFAITSLKNDL